MASMNFMRRRYWHGDFRIGNFDRATLSPGSPTGVLTASGLGGEVGAGFAEALGVGDADTLGGAPTACGVSDEHAASNGLEATSTTASRRTVDRTICQVPLFRRPGDRSRRTILESGVRHIYVAELTSPAVSVANRPPYG
jgi:hypothetical protein